MSTQHPPTHDAPPATLTADVIGGRLLAWAGGIAVVVGIALFLAMAVSRGWLDHTARIGLAGAGSGLLMIIGLWLHGRRGRTEASIVAVGAATVGLFATLAVGSGPYQLIDPLWAIAGALAVGAVATTLAIRWAGQAIAWVGLIGALASPVLVGADLQAVTIAVLGVAAACATATAIWRRWTWLAVAATAVCLPQWGSWLVAHGIAGAHLPQPTVVAIAAWFGLVALAAVLSEPVRRTAPSRPHAATMVLLVGNALLGGAFGWLSLTDDQHRLVGNLWLAGFGAAHLLAAALVTVRPEPGDPEPETPPRLRRGISRPLHGLLIVAGVTLGDLGFGLSAHGITLAAGWAVSAVVLGALRRRAVTRMPHRGLLQAGIGAQIALGLMHAIVDAPPGQLGLGVPTLAGTASVAMLAAACLICGQLERGEHAPLSDAVNAIGLVALAYLPAVMLSGDLIPAAWAGEAMALAAVARSEHRDAGVARYAGLAFLGLAGAHLTLVEAPPTALVIGAPSLAGAVLGLGALVVATAASAFAAPRGSWNRFGLAAGTAAATLYLVSVAIITAFQPVNTVGAIGDLGSTLLNLGVGVRQQGQVLLSVCWSVIGLGGVIAGLRRDQPAVRNAALGLLILAMAKVFLFDLSMLTSVYRVASFIALGLLLLATAFAYQRLKPPPAPDMRRVPRSLR